MRCKNGSILSLLQVAPLAGLKGLSPFVYGYEMDWLVVSEALGRGCTCFEA